MHAVLHIMVDLCPVSLEIELFEGRTLHLGQVDHKAVDHEVFTLTIDDHDEHSILKVDREGM